MRGYYLNSIHKTIGCRGGVGYGYDTGFTDEYELEIGHQCNASAKMIAMCCLHDEIMGLLNDSPSLLSQILVNKYHQLVKEVEDGVEVHRKEVKERDEDE